MRFIVLLVLLLVGCGGGGGEAPPVQTAPAPVATETPAPAPAPEPVAVQTTPISPPLVVPPNVEGWAEPIVILEPSQAWEFTKGLVDGAVFEPSILYENGVYTMWYSGAWDKCSLGVATSTDGKTWTKNPDNPIVGQGKLGMDRACRNTVLRYNGEVYVYFNDVAATDTVTYVTHSKDGVTNLAPPQVFMRSSATETAIANSWAVALPDGKIRFFYDSMSLAKTWEAFSAICDTPLGPCVKEPGPLKGLQTGKGAYGGGWSRLVDGRFDTYYLAGPNGIEAGHLPTYIYHACDVSTGPVAMGNKGNPLFPIPAGMDQHGDPFVVDGVETDGNSRLMFSEVDNWKGYSRIMMSSRVGPLSTVSCPTAP